MGSADAARAKEEAASALAEATTCVLTDFGPKNGSRQRQNGSKQHHNGSKQRPNGSKQRVSWDRGEAARAKEEAALALAEAAELQRGRRAPGRGQLPFIYI